jgi:hypothetical protein
LASQGDNTSGYKVFISHAISLCKEVTGILNCHPPISVEVEVLLSGTGNIGMNPILSTRYLVKSDHAPGIQDPSITTANFLFANSRSISPIFQIWLRFLIISDWNCPYIGANVEIAIAMITPNIETNPVTIYKLSRTFFWIFLTLLCKP